MKMKLPGGVREAMARLEKAGYAVWLVGGCVRDALRGQTPHDYDLTTSARPEELLRLFADRPCVLAGLSHGTVAPVFDRTPIEITTFRREGPYADHRRPGSVCFVDSLEEDLSRRDFTINAIAWHPSRGLRDPFGGELDLDRRLIRAVGEPDLRFEEDALRLLRALRFAARFSFSVEERTARALRSRASTLSLIALERITDELRGFFALASCGPLFAAFPEVFSALFPPLAGSSGWEETARALAAFSGGALPRLALVSRQAGESVTPYLRLTRREVAETDALFAALCAPPPETLGQVKRLAARSVAFASDLLGLWQALGQETDALGEQLLAAVERGDCLSRKDLALKGADLSDLPPAAIGEALNRALEGVLDGRVPNEKNALLAYIREKG